MDYVFKKFIVEVRVWLMSSNSITRGKRVKEFFFYGGFLI